MLEIRRKKTNLQDSKLVTDYDCIVFLTERGEGWVCEIKSEIIGFSTVDCVAINIWALFMVPEFDKKGIGIKLHNVMLDSYFTQTTEKVWLGTSPNTRAETFYRNLGWIEIG